MTTSEQIEIPLSKRKMTMMLIGSVAFVAIGLWLLISPPKIERGIFSNPILVFISGIASVLFFGLCAFSISKKLRDKGAGLIIDNSGITDNASGISAGHIPWSDIREIKTSQVMSQRFLMILVDNPNDYIGRQTNALKRKAAEMNFKSYGSPISISSNSLKVKFDELRTILQIELDKNKA